MDLVQQLATIGRNEWLSFIIIAFAIFFLIVEVIERFDVLAKKTGLESKSSKRFKKIEQDILDIKNEQENLELKIQETNQTFEDRQRERMEVSKNIQKGILDKLEVITQKLEKKDKLDLKKLRHSIVRAGEEAVFEGKISIRALKSLEEMYEEYSNTYHENGYVRTLMTKVRSLEVIGKLDENDEDIEE